MTELKTNIKDSLFWRNILYKIAKTHNLKLIMIYLNEKDKMGNHLVIIKIEEEN
jgi:hypothetical protein